MKQKEWDNLTQKQRDDFIFSNTDLFVSNIEFVTTGKSECKEVSVLPKIDIVNGELVRNDIKL